MDHRSDLASTSRSLQLLDKRDDYMSLSHNEQIQRVSTSNGLVNVASSTTNSFNYQCLTHHSHQRYKLLLDGLVHVCRVPHAKNLIEKIRFSRFLRRWEEHHIFLEHNRITSRIVRYNVYNATAING
jgi:hypothetical protein